MKRMNHCTLVWASICLWLFAGVAFCDEGISPPKPSPQYEPPEPSPLDGEENLFHGAKVTVCDHWSDRVGAFAIDGRYDNLNDYWGTAKDPAWMTVELPKLRSLNTVRLWNFWDGSRSYGYLIEGSLDGETWQTLVDQQEHTRPATSAGRTFQFDATEVKFVRITIQGRNAGRKIGAHVVEFQGHCLSPQRLAELNAWEEVPAGLHGAFGSKDVRYGRSVLPELEPRPEWSGTAWRGERINAQIVLWTAKGARQVRLNSSPLKSEQGDEIPAACVRSRFVRYVISDHNTSGEPATCIVPDILDTIDRLDLNPHSVRPVWLTIDVPSDTKPGTYRGALTVAASEGQSISLPLQLEVLPAVVPPPSQWAFRFDLWQNPWAVAHAHRVEPFSEAHLAILEPHLKLLAQAGQTFITTYITHDAWGETIYHNEGTMVEWIRGRDGAWRFDYTNFDKYVELALHCGITDAITCYTPVSWQNRYRYVDEATGEYVHVQWSPSSNEFESFWLVFLNDLEAHLKQRGWFERTYLGVNENPMPDTKAAIAMINKANPKWKITYAGHWRMELSEALDDYCIIIDHGPSREAIVGRRQSGQTTTFYVCCGPARPNSFTFSPPAESTWMGWHTAAKGYDGFLRWAYDSWTADPLHDTRHVNWPAGDCWLVYPGPRSSIRFERLREGIVDHEKIRILRELLELREDATAKQSLARLDAMLDRFTYAAAQQQPAAEVVRSAQELLTELTREAAR